MSPPMPFHAVSETAVSPAVLKSVVERSPEPLPLSPAVQVMATRGER